MKARQGGLLVLTLGLLGSQAGHLLAYQARFGAAAQQLQSTGAHAYFPGLVKTFIGAAAVLVLAGLFLIGLARVLSRRRAPLDGSAPSLLRLTAALFTIQLAVFAVQEAVEATLGGAPATSATSLLLWGALGQLPIAALAALALRWFLLRFDGAVAELRTVLAFATPGVHLAFAMSPVTAIAPARLVPRRVAAHPLLRRGPPSSPFSLS